MPYFWRLKCTKFDFRWASSQRSPDHLAGFEGSYTFKRKERKKKGRERDDKKQIEMARKREEEGKERKVTPRLTKILATPWLRQLRSLFNVRCVRCVGCKQRCKSPYRTDGRTNRQTDGRTGKTRNAACTGTVT